MAKNLLIVESPAKAKTIEKILGSDFEVKSCFGHIRDLTKEEMGIDIANGFRPRYAISEDKIKVVSDLQKLAQKSKEVWLATDEDREGEAISWHLCEVLNLDPATTKRIVFHEITKPAIEKAVAKPRTVNMDLVNAQQARRVLDRLVGFEISPVLWRKLSNQKHLSAGRVQSVAVKLIVEREREINKFQVSSSFRLEGFFHAEDLQKKDVTFKAERGANIETEKGAQEWLERCIGATYKVKEVLVKPAKKSPAPPFTTSTLQQEASRKLGYGVSRTMQIAQRLYENGYITYMRTDAVYLSETARTGAEQAINSMYGAKYHQPRQFKNKNESAQEAHEAIRPTDMMVQRVADSEQQRLYELIWKRTMASQMADAQIERTIAKIDILTKGKNDEALISNAESTLTATGEVIRFDGFLKVYTEGKDEEDGDEETDGMLPPLVVNQILDLQELRATQRFTRPLPRYTEASLVKKLEELGIGRPSTYAPTISTVQNRGYVERKDKDGVRREYHILSLRNDNITLKKDAEHVGAERSKLFPTDLGSVVTDFLAEHFEQVMDYHFTAGIEEEFDQIANGTKEWNKMIGDFYHPFHEQVALTMETAERASGEHLLGEEPGTGKPVIARLGRFGPMVQIGHPDDEEKPRFATLKPTQSIETITYEDAMDLFRLPFPLQDYEDKEVMVGAGRFGPYVKWGEQYISIPKGEDPLAVDDERAIQLIKEKQQADAPIGMYEGVPVGKGKGRFGPFLKWGTLYINVPRRYDFDNLSKEEIDELISAKLEKEQKRFIVEFPGENIAIENGRWGPFIRFGKKMIKLPFKGAGEKWTAEDLKDYTLEDVKKIILVVEPDAFTPKKKAASKKVAKKTGAKKTTTTKTPAKKTAVKKIAAKKK